MEHYIIHLVAYLPERTANPVSTWLPMARV